jgi:hypothetical protein
MNHSLYQDEILKALPFKRLPWLSRDDALRIKILFMKPEVI